MPKETSLEDLRREIKETTLEIYHLCGKRLLLSKKIAETKAREGIPIENLKVEEELRIEVLNVCDTFDLDKSFCIKLLKFLLEESKRVQKNIQKSEKKGT